MTGLSVWAGTFLAGIVLLWFLIGIRRRRRGEAPLENGQIPVLGVALEFRADPLKFLMLRRKKYGDAFTCKMAGKYMTFITCPFSFSSVIRQGKNLDFPKFAMETSMKVFGHVNYYDARYGISYEEIHQIFTRTLQGTSALDSLTSSMMQNLQFVISRMKTPADTDWSREGLQAFVSRILFEAGYMTLFGKNKMVLEENNVIDLETQHAAIQSAFKDFIEFDSVFPVVTGGAPIGLFTAAKKARENLTERFLHKNLKQNTCMSALINERMDLFDHSSNLTEMCKARTHVAMLWASQANTMPATFWTIFYLLRSPEALKAVKSEIESLLNVSNQKAGDINHPVVFTKEQLDSMAAVGSTVNEALRLSSATTMIRYAVQDCSLTLDSGQKLSVRKGDWIVLYPQLMHLDPDIYEDPLEFKYNRFLDDNQEEKTAFYKNGRKLKNYLMPFGSGASMCPGRFFAVNEIKQLLCLLLCYYDMELVDPLAPAPPLDNSRAGLGILQPKHDVEFRYRLKVH